MADCAHSIPASCVHPLTGSSAPGRAPDDLSLITELPDTFAPLGTVAPHPDAEVIELAGRVKALSEREDHLWDSIARAEDDIEAAMPPRPVCGGLVPPKLNEGWRSDGSNGPIFDPPGFGAKALQVEAEYRAALAAHDRGRTAKAARRGLPRLERIASRMSRRLRRWTTALVPLAPQTQAGLAAKAAAALAIQVDGAPADWTDALMAAVGRDALRLATALADGPAAHAPTSHEPDPIIGMHRRARELFAYAEAAATLNREAMAALDEMNALVLAGPAMPPSTPAGALAALEWGKEQLIQMMEQRDADTPWDRAIVAMLDGALAVFAELVGWDGGGASAPAAVNGSLAAAVADLHRLDPLQLLLCRRYHRNTEDIPGYAEAEVARDAALKCVLDVPARNWAGIVAKAGVLKVESVWHDRGVFDEMANGLAEDILRLAGRTWDPKTSREPKSAARPEAA